MKINGVDFDKFSNQDLVQLCMKYNLVIKTNKYTRNDLLNLIKKFMIEKMNKKQQNIQQQNIQQDPNIKSVSVNRGRRNSTSGNLQNNTNRNGPPKVNVHKRRLSQPTTNVEKINAVKTHEMNNIQQQSVNRVKQEISATNPKYDVIGIYPPVKKLICIGDIHGDLAVALKVLKLAEVIPQNANSRNVNGIHWCGGDAWVIQLGDQIDRCRPDEWEKNCVKDFDEVVEDEGSNMAIIKLFLRLDEEAKRFGGRLLGTLGNHELMNVDKDFRYVSPQEFLEFVPQNQRTTKYTNDGFPLGYYHRLKAFERGSNISKLYAVKKKSIIIIGSYLFVHGGLSTQLMGKYKISEINDIVTKWLLKTENQVESEIFNEIFREDDDMSPFWCRIFGEDEDNHENNIQNFNQLLNMINRNNRLLMPVKGMVISHTPQFMEDKYLNSLYNDRLWRIDVGMSRAFGKQDDCAYNKFRKPQILIIHNNSQFEKRIISLNSERYPSSNQGQNVDLSNSFMPF